MIGAAVTHALCGGWDHTPPCPHVPHHTSAQVQAGVAHVRILYAAAPDHAEEVLATIGAALRRGRLRHDGRLLGTWQVLDLRPDDVASRERAHVAALVAS